MQGGPQVFILQVDIQASLNQHLCCEHVVMARALQKAEKADCLIISLASGISTGATDYKQ